MTTPHKATPEQLDYAICEYLRQYDGNATDNPGLIELAGGKWRRIDARMQAMRKAGRIRFHGRSRKSHPEGIRAHGWEVVK